MSIDEGKTPKVQYDSLEKADGYRKYFNSRLTEFDLIHKPSTIRLLGKSLEGKEVIDYACGNGGSTKLLLELNPSKLVGIDLSEIMIDLAIKEFASHPDKSKTEFYVRDCSKPVNLGQFDLVFSRLLLHYAPTKEILFGKLTYSRSRLV